VAQAGRAVGLDAHARRLDFDPVRPAPPAPRERRGPRSALRVVSIGRHTRQTARTAAASAAAKSRSSRGIGHDRHAVAQLNAPALGTMRRGAGRAAAGTACAARF
jgi:hypothetical protein